MSEQSTWLSAHSAFTVKEVQEPDRISYTFERWSEELSCDNGNNDEKQM